MKSVLHITRLNLEDKLSHRKKYYTALTHTNSLKVWPRVPEEYGWGTRLKGDKTGEILNIKHSREKQR